jgi:hypothetical protein
MFPARLQAKVLAKPSWAKGHSLKMALAWPKVWKSQSQAIRLQL